MKQRFVSILLAMVMLLAIPTGLSAAKAESQTVFVNGKKIAYAQAPISENGTTLVSAKETIEALGLAFSWDKGNKRIIASSGEMTISIILNEPVAAVNGISIFLGTPAVERNGRTMVPLRLLTDGLGASMETKGKQISIKTVDPSKSKYYTGLPLQITNSAVKNLGTEKIVVNYKEYYYAGGAVHAYDFSASLNARGKAAFNNTTVKPGENFDSDGTNYVFFGRTIYSVVTGEKETVSKSYRLANQLYADGGTIEKQMRALYEQKEEEYKKQLKEELRKNNNVPFKVVDYSITYNSLGYPEANIKLWNLTTKKIISFELSFSTYDAYGDPVKGGYPYSNRYYGKVVNSSIGSGESPVYTWDLYGYEDTTKLKNIQIDRVAFSDGSVWKRK
ncbi:Copper amine oxidase N-terminal domain-containing protein [Paenibacillus algorifonticola]|uniref:Copper amine oxidase N-terminal domain-containing protein n=1 Tax=Paenibacillus algorifonticola TaxID=684063 RepID=A0A1I2B815_9BACL|nr:stalk domain-containing protein [Paenibacillus algorifonticola]SFE52127.1 Copper amine oxidase N-terminal domain-containing protein [Paenibacillus algorifonticola]